MKRSWAVRGAVVAGLLALLASALTQRPADAVAPPVPGLNSEQRIKLKERDRWLAEAQKLFREGKVAEAIKAAEKMLAIERALFGDVHEEIADLMGLVATWHEARGDYGAAIKARAEVVTIREKLHGAGHWRTVDARWELATTQRLARMGPEQRRALQRAKQLHAAVIRLHAQGKSAEALKVALEAHDLFKVSLGEKHPDYALSLNNLAYLYVSKGEHARALPLYEQALAILKAALGDKHPACATSLNNLALLHSSRGDYARALPLYEQARDICKASVGDKHPSYATSLHNLAAMHHSMGDYVKALPLYEQARDIRKTALGERHPDYAASLHNLAALYLSLRDYARALPLFEQARDIRKASLGDKHPDYAESLHNLAWLYLSMGEYRKALPLMEQARDIRRATLGEQHPLFATSLNNLAALYWSMGEHARALPLYEQARDISKANLGEKHPEYAASLHNLALLYERRGDYARALPLFEQARDLYKASLGERHPDYADTLNNLAGLHHARGEDGLAVSALEQALAVTRSHLERTALGLSERQHLALVGQLRGPTDLLLSLSPSAVAGAKAYAHLLTAKGAVLAQQRLRRDFQRLAESSKDEQVARLVRGLQASSAELSALAFAPIKSPEAYRRRVTELSLLMEKQEVELARRSADFRSARDRFRVSPAQLQEALPPGVALVDFRDYIYFPSATKEKGAKAHRRLAAFVVRRGSLARVDLGAAEPIAEDVVAWRGSIARRTRPSFGKDDPAQRLRDHLWAPLLPHLKGVKTVLLSPDAELTRLPFAALPGSGPDRYLVEEIALGYVAVPQLLPDLLEGKGRPKKERVPALLLVGDVDYGEAAKGAAGRRGPGPTRSLGAVKHLEETRAEVAAIKDSFGRRFRKGQVTDLREDEPTVAAVRTEAAKHDYLHLATHGFFADKEVRSALEPAKSERAGEDLFGRQGVVGWHPGLLSGIVLAGANKASVGSAGVLTALDVAELGLERCDLVVLSACETGLGETAGGEGVLGLQRAFQVAGARSVVASLWAVDDEATRALMVAFYEKLWHRKKPLSRLEAMRQAQLLMLREGRRRIMVRADPEKDKEKSPRLPPFYWAGFVLSGDWR
jgi:CHAT domain-containing protein/tetratricopeptide (TPR) repeat protein